MNTAVRTVVRLIVGKKWQTFIGIPYDTLCERTDQVLEELQWEYESTSKEPNLGEDIVYGSEETKTYEISNKDVEITYTSVTYDPLQRIFLNVLSRSETREKYEHSTAIIRISPIREETKSDVQVFVQRLASEVETDPWKISHPRFKYSPLLKYKVKTLWKYWMESANENGTERGKKT